MNRRGVGSPAGSGQVNIQWDALGWLTTLTGAGVSVELYLQGDTGITKSTNDLTGWADQSGNARDGTGVGAPQVNVTGLNGRGTVLCDGSDDGVDIAWDPPAPGTTPTWWYIVAKQVSWASADRMIGGDGNNMRIQGITATPQVRAGNATLAGDLIAMTLGSWFRVMAKFANSADAATGDYLKIGSVGGTRGSAFGNQDPTGISLAMVDGGANFGNFEFALVIACSSEPSAAVIAQLDARTKHATGGYGSGVAT